jgi:hypothetical protein
MTTTLWLRVSSVISLLFAAGHAFGGLTYWSPNGENPVLEAMRTVHFDVMGVSRSYFAPDIVGHPRVCGRCMPQPAIAISSEVALTRMAVCVPMAHRRML